MQRLKKILEDHPEIEFYGMQTLLKEHGIKSHYNGYQVLIVGDIAITHESNAEPDENDLIVRGYVIGEF